MLTPNTGSRENNAGAPSEHDAVVRTEASFRVEPKPLYNNARERNGLVLSKAGKY